MNLPKFEMSNYSKREIGLMIASYAIGKVLSMIDGARFEEETRKIVRDEMSKMNGGNL